MIMKKLLLITFALTALASPAFAQDDPNDRPLQSLRGDYNQVGVVAHVKVSDVKLAAPGAHQLYLLRGVVVEPFKGKSKRGQKIEFYMAVEEGFDANSRLGDWVVFLEGSSNTPDNKPGWFTLENSSTPYSKNVVSKMRRIKSATRRR